MQNPKLVVYENSLEQKLKILSFAVLAFVVLVAIVLTLVAFAGSSPDEENIVQSALIFLKKQILSFTPLGLFYSALIGNLFFFQLPLEAFFSYSLLKGNPAVFSAALILGGVIITEIFNYTVGRKFSNIVLQLISAKKIYGVKRMANKYGPYAVFLFSFVPIFPSPILTFTLGLTRYNAQKLFLFLILGNVLKYTVIALLAVFARPLLESFL